jgi:fluoroquinolone transport system permease protein
MRFLSALINDIRYQIKYGFYFLYAFFSAVYIAALFLCPQEYKKAVASIIILTDPAMLGSFFIGGIWLLEKGEGLHSFWGISPLRPVEYILSKAVSLAIISTVSADIIIMVGLREAVNYFALSVSVFTGSMIFTTIGLIVASYARSINQYMLFVSPFEVIVAFPPILAVFGITHPALDIIPGMALWRIIGCTVGMTDSVGIWLYIILFVWLGIVFFLANRRIPQALLMEGGGKA